MPTGFAPFLAEAPQKRRVFFSFHYQQDVWRVNRVRQSWRFCNENEREAEGFFDASLWESSKRKGDDSLKELIREGMKNTSVTCVLAGTHTWARRWVRYEIARSLVKGNGLLVVKIHNMADPNGNGCAEGPNPLDNMSVYRVDDGRILIAEWDNAGKWIRYGDYTQGIDLPQSWRAPSNTNVVQLSSYSRIYDYVVDNGSENFASWVAAAAQDASR